ncbi:MAG: CRISPR-associated protein Cas4 [Acidobacteria bacterium]|nr:CRISPR-associated protein Cas4 [Acidobacteriota bacterium]
MYDEDDLLPISALQHLAFCERQWALIHLEGAWAENRLTVEGHHLHDRAHRPETESRRDLRIARGLRLRSLRLGLSGIADVVEFHRIGNDSTAAGVSLSEVTGLWQPRPVEYKRGRPKLGPYDEIQLCAQALCLEEMLGISIPAGDLFYGEPRQRSEVVFSPDLREKTESLTARLHELTLSGKTPLARYEKKCDSCSLYELCLPKGLGRTHTVADYLFEAISQHEGKEP